MKYCPALPPPKAIHTDIRQQSTLLICMALKHIAAIWYENRTLPPSLLPMRYTAHNMAVQN